MINTHPINRTSGLLPLDLDEWLSRYQLTVFGMAVTAGPDFSALGHVLPQRERGAAASNGQRAGDLWLCDADFLEPRVGAIPP